jgi:hypothetical protein
MIRKTEELEQIKRSMQVTIDEAHQEIVRLEHSLSERDSTILFLQNELHNTTSIVTSSTPYKTSNPPAHNSNIQPRNIINHSNHSNVSSGSSDHINIFITRLGISIWINKYKTTRDLKIAIAGQVQVHSNDIKLYYRDKRIEDSKPLTEYPLNTFMGEII